MSEVADQVYQLLRESLDLEDGDAQIALREEAVRLADLGGDLKLQYFAREVFVRACIFGGATEKGLVAFAWLLAQFDNHPGRFDQWAILWKYKWINGVICDFPQISKQRIYEMLDDLEQRALKAGYGLRAVTNQRYRAEKFWDNREQAIEYFRELEELPPDSLSNCVLCESDERVSFAIYSGDDKRALEIALPILNGGEKCGSVPHRTYANVLLPLIRLGRHDEALRYHLKSYSLIANNKAFLDKVADHAICLALTENLKQAMALVEAHYVWTETNRDLYSHFRFFRAAWLVCELLARQNTWIDLNMVGSFPLYSGDSLYQCSELAAWFKQKAEGIAKRFDERNETDFFMRTITETPALKKLVAPFPLQDVVPSKAEWT
jgi:tetratricopeptide (TPR) repeat protein